MGSRQSAPTRERVCGTACDDAVPGDVRDDTIAKIRRIMQGKYFAKMKELAASGDEKGVAVVACTDLSKGLEACNIQIVYRCSGMHYSSSTLDVTTGTFLDSSTHMRLNRHPVYEGAISCRICITGNVLCTMFVENISDVDLLLAC